MPAFRSPLTVEKWMWLLFKLVLGFAWTSMMLFATPDSISANVSFGRLSIWTVGTALGALVSLVGMLMATSSRPKRALRGLTVELVGILFFAGGPVQYLGLQLGFLTTEFEARAALACFVAAMLIAIAIRAQQVIRDFHREATSAWKGAAS